MTAILREKTISEIIPVVQRDTIQEIKQLVRGYNPSVKLYIGPLNSTEWTPDGMKIFRELGEHASVTVLLRHNVSDLISIDTSVSKVSGDLIFKVEAKEK